MRATISSLKHKVTNYRNCKKFDVRNCLSDIQQGHFECKSRVIQMKNSDKS